MQTQLDLRLARHGAILLLLGMLTGFGIRHFPNRGAGNVAHLVALLGGYGLIAIGLLWPKLSLGRFWSTAGAWITAASLYLNWLGVVFFVLSSGAGAAGSVIPGSATLWGNLGSTVLKLAVVTSLLSVLIILVGLRKLTSPMESRGAASATVANT